MKQLLVLSGKGGTGKTTVASAMIALSEAKVYADCDVDAPNLHLVMSQKSAPERTDFFGMKKAFIDPEKCTQCGVCKSNCRFDAIHVTPDYSIDPYACEGCGLCVRLCPSDAIQMVNVKAGDVMVYEEQSLFATAKLKMGFGTSGLLVSEVKRQLKRGAHEDLSIVDGSPGIGCPVIASMSGADLVLIVAEPSLSGISDMDRIIKTAKVFSTKAVVCTNKWDLNPEMTEDIKKYCLDHGLTYLGEIPYDSHVIEAVNAGNNIMTYDCKASLALRHIYLKLMPILMKEHALFEISSS